ncbi:MAG: hypothetical protein AAF430_13980 [Myxococcota bacterium]
MLEANAVGPRRSRSQKCAAGEFDLDHFCDIEREERGFRVDVLRHNSIAAREGEPLLGSPSPAAP